MYEHRTQHLLSRATFARRVARHVILALFVLGFGLGIGVVGYHYFAELPWLDALLNASMILSGMGPVDPLHKPMAKLFASFYALFSGLAFIAVASVLVAPFAHRILHRLHLDKQ
ncbi:MAG TPA: two pore domain potassium channel family protein [Burkholderiales bacterium]|nr:two pore domain potassium channel family protein [Burkholderiales bacterium]